MCLLNIGYIPGAFISTFQTTEGAQMWEILRTEHNVITMIKSSEKGEPALTKLAQILLDEINPRVKERRFKQMAGHMTRQIMESNIVGYNHYQYGFRFVNNPVYTTASTYRKRFDTEFNKIALR